MSPARLLRCQGSNVVQGRYHGATTSEANKPPLPQPRGSTCQPAAARGLSSAGSSRAIRERSSQGRRAWAEIVAAKGTRLDPEPNVYVMDNSSEYSLPTSPWFVESAVPEPIKSACPSLLGSPSSEVSCMTPAPPCRERAPSSRRLADAVALHWLLRGCQGGWNVLCRRFEAWDCSHDRLESNNEPMDSCTVSQSVEPGQSSQGKWRVSSRVANM